MFRPIPSIVEVGPSLTRVRGELGRRSQGQQQLLQLPVECGGPRLSGQLRAPRGQEVPGDIRLPSVQIQYSRFVLPNKRAKSQQPF